MDNKLILLVGVVLVSGCTDIQGGTTSSGSPVQIADFSINDNSLYTEQEAVVNLVLENHEADAEITTLELVNTGALKVQSSNWQEQCSSSRLPDPVNGQSGILECSWKIKAPSESELGAFKSKSYAPQLMLRYKSEHSNSKQPVKVHAKPSSDINSPKTVSRKISNGEVSTSINFENPVPLEIDTPATVKISGNDQHIVSDRYGFQISPTSMIKNCKGKEPVNGKLEFEVPVQQGGKAQFNCVLSPQRETTRNLILSTSYKYQKAPSLSVEVVSQ